MQERVTVMRIAEDWARQFARGVRIGEDRTQAILKGEAKPEEGKSEKNGRTTLEKLGMFTGEVMTNWGYTMRSTGPIV